MLQVGFWVLLAFFGVFAAVMLREPRSLWSGVAFFFFMLAFGGYMLVVAAVCSDWLAAHAAAMWGLIALAALAAVFVLALPLLLFFMFLIEGVRVLRHEGLTPANSLSLAFAVLWFGFLFVWPLVGRWQSGFGTMVYILVSFSAVYMLALMAMYALSALLNLVHWRKARRLDYIVVLGAGVLGDKVPPLLAGRIRRGMELLEKNPGAVLIMSGGQGPGENLPEGDAMAAYAIEHGADPARILCERQSANTEENLRFSRAFMRGEAPRVALVTTAYHVFRALLLAKGLGMRCVGFGSKTRWYFTLNALLREFAGYVRLTYRRHIRVMAAAAGALALAYWAAMR